MKEKNRQERKAEKRVKKGRHTLKKLVEIALGVKMQS